jgi:acyl carrier protein
MNRDHMTLDELKAIVLEELTKVAPDLADEAIPDDADLRDEFDLDSMDFLNWITALHQRLGVAIPELDYPKLSSLSAAADYLIDKVKGSAK